MKFYQVKSTEKGSQPTRWFRTLVPSGITFSQLYVLLGYIHGELVVSGLSQYYTYETKEMDLCIEEFIDGEPDREDSYYDIYDAQRTYIDTFFKEGLKLDQYTGRDFDLAILVEKDAEEYPDLIAPEVIKVSRAIAQEDGWEPDDGMLPLPEFEIVHDENRWFRSSEELEDEIATGSVMHVSDDPVTPEESVFKGKYTRTMEQAAGVFEPLYEDAEIAELLKSYLAAREAHDPFAGAIEDDLDDLVFTRLDRHFSDFNLEATMGEDGKLLAELYRQMSERQVQAPGIEAILKKFDLKSLRQIAYDFDLDVPEKAPRKRLTKVIISQLFSPAAVIDRLAALEDSEMDLFMATMQRQLGRFPKNDSELADADELEYELLILPVGQGRYFVPQYIRNIYEEYWTEAQELKRQQRLWLSRCLEIAGAFYGVMPWDVLAQLFARKFKNVERSELEDLFRSAPDYTSDFIEYDGRLMLRGFDEDDYYKILEDRIQHDKPFYIPSRKEIEEYWDKQCLLSSPSHQAMLRFLKNEFGYDDAAAAFMVSNIYHMINNEVRLQDVLDTLEKSAAADGEEFAFNSEKAFEKFVGLYMDMSNNSHIMANRGYTPHDLFYATGGLRGLPKDMMISPRGPEAAALLDESRAELANRGIRIDEERIDAMLQGEKKKKIGRNEPCPCGSGKKYKNCCGKN